MKKINLVFVFILSACTVQGKAIYSQGVISGWEHNGFKNTKNGVEILFSVENRDYITLDETLVGITTKDRKSGINSAIGKKPFIVKVELKTTNEYVYIKQNAKLILDGKEYMPLKVEKGIDRVLSGRVKSEVLSPDYDGFMLIDNALDGIDHNWLWLEFDIATPHPNQNFTLFLDVKNDESYETLEANFAAKVISIHHH
ncbi:hypothetical protein J2X32_003130 [Rheinheimera pacifica]|uniref:hypothetical protein n=1 Tax=Rheinheimera pacifica TaxID=173990 RepID=UPI0028672AEE|nr:hypothetical protein [Rheinheimera pacifica]MDR6984486.1 hypothetical protein [Rheinheimera pacifica]